LNRVPQSRDVVGEIDNRTMYLMLDNFTESIATRRDYWQPASERFQARVRKWIVNRRQNENVRR
jgi:hypothetical protein